MLIQADDKIELVSEKTRQDGSGVKIGLAGNWRQATEKAYRDGEPVIYSYWGGGKKYISPSEFEKLSYEDSEIYQPCYERLFRSSVPDSYIRMRGNNIFLSICKLSYNSEEMLFSSRYRKLLEAFHEARPGIFEYSERGGKRPIEATRQKLLRWFRLYEYEYNILFMDRELGRRVFEELKEAAVKVYETGLYLKGAGEKQGSTVKMYEISDGLFKIEITFRKNTFKKLKIDITKMTRQENCIKLLSNSAIIEIMKLTGGEAVRQLQYEFVNENNILSRILKLERESLRSEARFEAVEKQLTTESLRSEARLEAVEKQLTTMKKLLERQGLKI